MFKEISSEFDYPEAENLISEYWEKNNIFEESLRQREGHPDFVFYEGPPTANGLPHIGHLISRTVKDTICRYKTMKGFRVERKAGWDTQGLPVELEVEKSLGFSIKEKIAEYGIENFNRKCRESVFKYKKEWDDFTRRIGYWLDLDDAYITYTNDYIESVWWALSRFHREGYLYRGRKIVPWCPRCGTALSSHEVAQGYETVSDPSIFVKMEIVDRPGVYFLVWTTTPWTLISNVALAVHPNYKYVEIRQGDENLILEKSRAKLLFGDELNIKNEYTGRELSGTNYKPLYDFIKPEKKSHYVTTAEFVTTDEGTGIVHIAPAFGADDYALSNKYDLPIIQAVNEKGEFISEVKTWKGKFVKEADPEIIEDLRSRNLLLKAENYSHTYPFCWRCHSPLIYYARASWFIRTTAYKDKMIANNKKINWQPPEIRDGRFGEWLENNVDWALSRDRYWGTPLPIWICSECGQEQSVSGIKELKELGENVPDDIELHKPYVDRIYLKCPKCGGKMVRTPEVIDAWFDSGSMPFAQYHYPFENEEKFKNRFPADFIAEGIDQTRGWFYSLLAISTFLFGEPAYKNIVVNELILDKNGQKMSKSQGNVVFANDILTKMGADAARWYMMSTSQVWLPTKFDPDGVIEVAKKFLSTLKNCYSFFALYARIDGFNPKEINPEELKPTSIDKWLKSKITTLIRDVGKSYESFEITRACRSIQQFVIEELSNWYIRRCRRRYWGPELTVDKKTAYYYLWDALIEVCKLAAPVAPFITEKLYLNLVEPLEDKELISVHLDYFPKADEKYIDAKLENLMNDIQTIVSLGLAARKKAKIKVRQPLSEILISVSGRAGAADYDILIDHIKEELNIKNIHFVDNIDDLVIYKIKPNFRSLGPKFGKDVNEAARLLKELSPEEVSEFKENGSIDLTIGGKQIGVSAEDVEFLREFAPEYEVISEGGVSVAVNIVITENLREEGFSREVVNKVQNMRKTAGFDVLDNIIIDIKCNDTLKTAIERYKDYIAKETLAQDIVIYSDGDERKKRSDILLSGEPVSKKWDINGEEAKITIQRIGG